MYPYNPYSNHYDPPHYRTYHPIPPYYQTYFPSRNTAQVNPTMFMDSARQTKELIKDGTLISEKIAGSKPFSIDIMRAAQESNKAKVEELIKSIGIKHKPQVSYTPNGLTLTFIHEQNDIDCCHLILKIRWANP
jgi:hypothetical protein